MWVELTTQQTRMVAAGYKKETGEMILAQVFPDAGKMGTITIKEKYASEVWALMNSIIERQEKEKNNSAKLSQSKKR